MKAQPIVQSHIHLTDMLAKLYLFLAQSLDRCVSEAARISYPEPELQSNLASTRTTLLDMLSVNQIVKGRVEQECDRYSIPCHRMSQGRTGEGWCSR